MGLVPGRGVNWVPVGGRVRPAREGYGAMEG